MGARFRRGETWQFAARALGAEPDDEELRAFGALQLRPRIGGEITAADKFRVAKTRQNDHFSSACAGIRWIAAYRKKRAQLGPAAASERGESMTTILPVIMCGGSGTRIWPESRESLPKQFIPLIGDRSTFQSIVSLLGDRAIFEPPV